ncbi:MAG TPA: PhnD/SsuA/transferrin family substrate-binding protein [Burkholderiales bacterium]
MGRTIAARARRALLGLALCTTAFAAGAEPLVLLAQPVPRDEHPAQDYLALTAYLQTLTGRAWRLQTPPIFPAYWEAVRHGRHDLALDALHFADYRVRKLGFHPLAVSRDVSGYSLLARAADRIADPERIVGKRVAVLGLLSLGALRLNALFPDPLRQPVVVEAGSVPEVLELLRARAVKAAFLPTAALAAHAVGRDFAILLTTEPMPRLALSASPRLPAELRERIRAGVLAAHESEAGREMLRAIGLAGFAAAGGADLANQSYVLRGYWGY